MKWLLSDPNYGDMVRVKIGDFYHYGIYASDDEVIQFGKPPINGFARQQDVSVCTTDLTEFSCGTFIEVASPEKKEKKARRKAKAAVEFARSRIGEKGYHILYNNCEHFAYECAYGYKYSEQVDEVRKDWQTMPVCDVYVRKFPFACVDERVYPKRREKEINVCRAEKVRQEKFYVWKLLEEALFRSFRLQLKKCKPKKEGNKWVCKGAYFSLTHSGDLACVAVSNHPVGVDLERIDAQRFEKLPAEKICTPTEIEALPVEDRARELNRLWTVKEAAFKAENGETFLPHTIETDGLFKRTKTVCADGAEYFLTVVGNAAGMMKVLSDGDIKTDK